MGLVSDFRSKNLSIILKVLVEPNEFLRRAIGVKELDRCYFVTSFTTESEFSCFGTVVSSQLVKQKRNVISLPKSC